MSRIGQYPGRGRGSSCRDQMNPVNVTDAAASQTITPAARTQDVEPNDTTMSPAMATVSPTYPTRRDQTAIRQCSLSCNSIGSSMLRLFHGCAVGVVRPGLFGLQVEFIARVRCQTLGEVLVVA
jgi:hypothetical protein